MPRSHHLGKYCWHVTRIRMCEWRHHKLASLASSPSKCGSAHPLTDMSRWQARILSSHCTQHLHTGHQQRKSKCFGHILACPRHNPDWKDSVLLPRRKCDFPGRKIATWRSQAHRCNAPPKDGIARRLSCILPKGHMLRCHKSLGVAHKRSRRHQHLVRPSCWL